MRSPKAEIRRPTRLLRAWRVFWAKPAQQVAVDAVLGGPVAVPTGKPEKAGDAGFDEVDRVLSLALDTVVNAVDGYRKRKEGSL